MDNAGVDIIDVLASSMSASDSLIISVSGLFKFTRDSIWKYL